MVDRPFPVQEIFASIQLEQFKINEDSHHINLKDLQIMLINNQKIIHQVQYMQNFFKTKAKYFKLSLNKNVTNPLPQI